MLLPGAGIRLSDSRGMAAGNKTLWLASHILISLFWLNVLRFVSLLNSIFLRLYLRLIFHYNYVDYICFGHVT